MFKNVEDLLLWSIQVRNLTFVWLVLMPWIKIYTLASPFHPSDRHLDVEKWLEFVQECSRTAAFGASLMWQPCSVC
jgi:hypothetical protein